MDNTIISNHNPNEEQTSPLLVIYFQPTPGVETEFTQWVSPKGRKRETSTRYKNRTRDRVTVNPGVEMKSTPEVKNKGRTLESIDNAFMQQNNLNELQFLFNLIDNNSRTLH